MKLLASIAFGALVVAIATPGIAFAQAAGYSGGGGGGMGGGGGGGAFGSSGSAFGSSGSMFGSSGSSFSSSSGSGMAFGGSSAFSSTGTSANGAQSGMVGMGGGGMYGGTGYGAANGANRSGSNYSSSQYGRNGASQYGQYGGGQGRQGSSRRGASGQSQNQGMGGGNAGTPGSTQTYFEPRIDVGFAVPQAQPAVVQASVAAPWRSPGLSGRFGSVQVSVQGDTVTLRGTVSSENDRLLAAQMAMLEPAVSSVRNELTVAAPAANPPR